MHIACYIPTHFSDPPNSGLSVARQIAMISYRTPRAYEAKFGRSTCETTGKFQARKYLEYQVCDWV